MTSREIVDGVIASVNAKIARRKRNFEHLCKLANEMNDQRMADIMTAQVQLLERIEKDIIQVEMDAKISYMGINTD